MADLPERSDVRCPLCRNADAEALNREYARDKKRTYTECRVCGMVFVPRHEHISEEAEKARYDTHENDAQDPGYRRFLSRTAIPLLSLIAQIEMQGEGSIPALADACASKATALDSDTCLAQRQACEQVLATTTTPSGNNRSREEGSTANRRWRGLDFGCGPGPALNELLEASPLVQPPVALYDLFYQPDTSVLVADGAPRQYDFVTCTEVVEHLAEVGPTVDRLWAMVRPGGIMAIMTKRVLTATEFTRWHYKNDPTHISFFHARSFEYLRDRYRPLAMFFHAADVVLFVKSSVA